MKKNLERIDFLWEHFHTFYKTTYNPLLNLSLKDITFKIDQTDLTPDDLISITHDFYKQLDSYFYNAFNNIFKTKNDHIIFRNGLTGDINCKGDTLSLSSCKESFITINRNFTIDDILTTIHECEHATSNFINPEHHFYPKWLFVETNTLFMELIAIDYINNLLKDDHIKVLKINLFLAQAKNAVNIINCLNLMKNEKITQEYQNDAELVLAGTSYNISAENINSLFTEDNDALQDYLTSFMFALELYYMYKEDKEKALYYLKKLILLNCKSQLEYYNKIKKFGITPNLHLQKYHQECWNTMLSLSRKQN